MTELRNEIKITHDENKNETQPKKFSSRKKKGFFWREAAWVSLALQARNHSGSLSVILLCRNRIKQVGRS